MDKNEVITLSSDEEGDCTYRHEQDLKPSTVIQPVLNNNKEHLKLYPEKKKMAVKRNLIIKCTKDDVKFVKLPNLFEKKIMKGLNESPEFVDLVESLEKPDDNSKDQFQYSNIDSSKTVKQKNLANHSKLDIIEIDEIPNYPSPEKKTHLDVSNPKEEKINIPSSSIEKNENNMTGVQLNSILKTDTANKESKECGSKLGKRNTDEDCNQNLKFFTEFVDYCGSLEKIPNDRARLTKKLMKRYGEADSSYTKSQEFKMLIQKCKDKVNLNNLYLIAKEVTDELSYRKKIIVGKTVASKIAPVKSQTGTTSAENGENAQEVSIKKSKKRRKIISQIIAKLEKLGNKIRELEKKEVDLSDEEESSYVQLQRYRERFCQIHKKLCKYTSEVVNPDVIYNPKICFTESKYPAINKCIETWLNKTKRFPDFSDILKLLESQSSSLGLPSSRESVRAIAIEIFQQVGAMLQRKRIYDLWDSLCEFLGTGEDPASRDPVLDQMLKSNFEARIKKEQEIFQHFSELQEKERLEPEEVPDEEANRSPVESGSEDDRELEGIENSLHRKLDDAIMRDTEDNEADFEENTQGTKGSDGGGNDLGNEFEPLIPENPVIKSKESKNNFRNCKSLKWRSENFGKTACLSTNSEDSNPPTENEKEKISEVVTVENFKADSLGVYDKIKAEMIQIYVSPTKRPLNVEKENASCKKKCPENSKNEESKFDIYGFAEETDKICEKTNGVFNVHCCQVYSDNVFEDLFEKKRVFRDLTNVTRLMELHGKRKKVSGLYSPSFFHPSFLRFEKSSWKKRFKVGFKLVGSKNQKCALSQDEKSGETVKSDSGGGTEEKKIENNSGTGKDNEGDNTFSGDGNGREEDNNDDKNKKNGKPGEGANENQVEEEEDEENDEESNDNMNDETVEQPFQEQKIEKQTDKNVNGNTALKNITKPDVNIEAEEWSEAQSETLKSEPTNNAGGEETSEKAQIPGGEVQKNSGKEIGLDQVDEEIDKGSHTEVSQIKEKEDVETHKDEISVSETADNQCEVVTPDIVFKDEGEVVELQSVGREKEKESNEVIKMEATSSKTEQQCDLAEGKIQNQSFATGNEKEAVSTGVAEKAEDIKIDVIFNKNENKKAETLKQEVAVNKLGTSSMPIELDLTSFKSQKRSAPSTSDEERVKRFLMHSPSSISITPPRKLSRSKPPSQAALQAIATLRNLKGISATRVRGKPKNEDDVVVIGGSFRRNIQQEIDSVRRKRTHLPVISCVQSMNSTTPKIVTVQGNVTEFDHSWQEVPNNGNSVFQISDSCPIKISNVWGSLPDNFKQSGSKNDSVAPGCSSGQTSPGSSSHKKKNAKKAVEYVVLD